MDLENYMKLGLKVEQELTDSEIEKIVSRSEFQKTLDKLLRFATLRPRSEREVGMWFRRRMVHESLFLKLLSKLRKLELLDDAKFAKWWVGQRLQFRQKSKRELVYELKAKGIDKDVIDDTLVGVDIDEQKIAGKILAKKRYKWEKLSSEQANKKMSEFLARRGFSWDIIKSVLKEIG